MKLRQLFAIAMSCIWLWACPQCQSQIPSEKPEAAQRIGVDQQLGETVPLELKFNDDQNNYVALGDFFDGRRPVILSFNYSDCPRMCIVQFNRLVAGLIALDLKPNKDFQIVSISLDWREKPGKAKETKSKYLANYGNLETADGWHFLVGNEAAISEAANACGIRFRYFAEQDSFSHPAAFIFCSPQGQIIRYLDGLDGEMETKIRPALIEAGEGRVGTFLDKAMYFTSCFEYDAVTGKTTLVAKRIMTVGGLLTLIALLVGLVPYWLVRRRAANTSEINPMDPKSLTSGVV